MDSVPKRKTNRRALSVKLTWRCDVTVDDVRGPRGIRALPPPVAGSAVWSPRTLHPLANAADFLCASSSRREAAVVMMMMMAVMMDACGDESAGLPGSNNKSQSVCDLQKASS